MSVNKAFDGDAVGTGQRSRDYAMTSGQGPTFTKANQTSKREKALIFVLVICVIAVIALVVALIVTNTNSDDDDDKADVPEICTTADCAQAASRILENVDTTAEPCEDFYQFACGNWKRRNVIPEDKTGQNVFGVLRDNVQTINKYLLEDEDLYADFEAGQKAKDMYVSCTNLEKIESLDLNVSYPLLEEVGGWPVLGNNIGGKWVEANFDLVKLLTILRKYNNRPIISLYVSSDVKDSDRYITYMDQPSFGLPGRDYYLDPSVGHMRTAYFTLAKSVAELFGADPAVADADTSRMIQLETDLANISMRAEDRRDNEALYNKFPISGLAANLSEPAPGDAIQFSWQDYVNSIMNMTDVKVTINDTEPVVVRAIPYFQQLSGVLNQYTKRDIANYVVWSIMKNRANNLPERFRDKILEYEEVVYGTGTARARWRECEEYAVENMGMAVGHMFVKETFDGSAQDVALEMISDIRIAFKELLDELDWMDEDTKVLAREKADAIREWIGYPDGLLNQTKLTEAYENYTVNANGYFENVLNNLKRAASAGLKMLREKYDKTVWSTPPSTVNAFYSSILNTIMFPAGILQPPFYSQSQPKSMNYGGIGVVIGHEITHGFDDRGRQYDKDGNLEQWWSQTIIDEFKGKAQCIIDQYDQFLVTEANLTVNGINTQGENIADNGGLKQSFKAYRKWVESNGKEEPLLPGISYNHNQLFFINFAQIWCNNMREEAMIGSIKTGVHSPGEFRVIGTLQNSPDFSRAFGCKNNQHMSPNGKCFVW